MPVVSKTPQTNVQLSNRALSELEHLAAEWSISREAAVRRLLEEYLDVQSSCRNEDLLQTHISTVLHYPVRTRVKGVPAVTRRLAVRVPEEMLQAVGTFAYRIRGHSHRQAHRDYCSRPLADPLATAIALRRPYVDEGLDGLPPLLERRQADGLWRLVIAATLTETELLALRPKSSPAIQLLITEGDFAWHSPWRYEVAHHVARHLLGGPDVATNLQWLGAQDEDFQAEEDSLRDLEYGVHEFTSDGPTLNTDEGRAATMIWRAERSLTHDHLAEWIIDLPTSNSRSLTVTPPGWTLRMPEEWTSLPFPGASNLSPSTEQALANGRLLRIDLDGRSALWPLTTKGAKVAPVPRFEYFVVGARKHRLNARQIAEAALVSRRGDQEGAPPSAPRVPVQVAYELGLASMDERDKVYLEARQETEIAIQDYIDKVSDKVTEDVLTKLRAAASDLENFRRMVGRLWRSHRIQFRPVPPHWTWDIDSVPEALVSCSGSQLTVLGQEWLAEVRLALQREMHGAWRKAMWQAIPGRTLAENRRNAGILWDDLV